MLAGALAMDEHGTPMVDPVAAARTGSLPDDEFRRLFDRFHGPVFAFFARRGLSREESLELTQETFLRVYRNIGEFRGETGFISWLLRIAANLWKNELRRRAAAKRDALEVPIDGAAGGPRALPAPEPDPLAGALAAERARLVRRLVGEMPPQMRRCFLLRLAHDLKYREIAGVMELSVDTVKSQLHQARQRLKRELDRHLTAGRA